MHQIKSLETGPGLEGAAGVTWVQWTFQSEPTEALPAGVSNVSSFLDLTQLVRARSSSQLQGGAGSDSDGGGPSSDDGSRIPAGVPRAGVLGQ